ncbi:pyruvate:ferredoxin (flavodoxin) oxidoreductase [Mucisphaera calidilacus]|uniref:Pyruvate-flavodoxin oxidoreductase n=1 Tax=Mucisphaera calidilacus TaxID=2527982 RepID=A0A518BVX6_9BACT|nr:pyruvate:ferredoxin (flavodoxin) oxidoreductase [Mucisphaera calidilacus]QDU71084.1 Pyruvate-flavodoxin oxidoreductase [Mucisphaera calidilacus]
MIQPAQTPASEAVAPVQWKTMDGNEAVASVAYRLTELAAIYPITPSSPMGEFYEEWSTQDRTNLWGMIPQAVEMQSEAGAAGAVHGGLQAGTLTTTFTASQGLLLMIPNMYKIAGELHPFVMHVAARTLATHALSIFGDHSDVMSCRGTGFAMLASCSVQEAHDMAAVAHAATLESRIPFLHFMDGFRTSHEVSRIEVMSDDALRTLVSDESILDFRGRRLDPDTPSIRGTAQNPDVFFQCREAANAYYEAVPEIVERTFARLEKATGRAYQLFEYVGDPDAEDVVVAMGSGVETLEETAAKLRGEGRKVGVLNVRLYRPWSQDHFLAALPTSVRRVAVLDRCKEPGAPGEPLYLDVVGALDSAEREGRLEARPMVVGGRYGLSSKEFTPGMAKAVFDHLREDRPRHGFTIGIVDDVTRTSLKWDPSFSVESDDCFRALFYGLGSDGTVGANKNSIKIIGTETDNYAQGYFVYDSKKSGALTVSHLRFGPERIRSPYLISEADFVGCHQQVFLDQVDVLGAARECGVFLLNSPYPADKVWDHLPARAQRVIREKRLRFYTIDALTVAREAGMGQRINTIMQTCFFAISGVLPSDEAIARIKHAIETTYARKGKEIVEKNFAAVDAAVANLHQVEIPEAADAGYEVPPTVPEEAPDFVQRITAKILAGEGDLLPVSAFPVDGTWPTGTSQWEKRGIATETPRWDEDLCIQCNKCALVCPHAAIRMKLVDESDLAGAPEGFVAVDAKGKDFKGKRYTLSVAPDDCTGCELCVEVCPAIDRENPDRCALEMKPRLDDLDGQRDRFDFFRGLPQMQRERVVRLDAKGSQMIEPLFEFSGACSGCGETPYIKLLTQLYGDRLLIANATGCSSIFGGNLPTTPYTTDACGRGPAWSNSLFEDNAEYGYGMRLGADLHAREAAALLDRLEGSLPAAAVAVLKDPDKAISERYEAIDAIRKTLASVSDPAAKRLATVLANLVDRSVWIIGGDGWAYDIGFGGLDHVLAQSRNVNMLVLDTEVYSNTGGQASKATPLGAAARFATTGKLTGKKDLGQIAMSYGHAYVGSIALGANDNHAVKVIQEAESYDGPSLVVAYAHCIAHGYDLKDGLNHQKLAVSAGVWPLYRFDPRRSDEGKNPLQVDMPKGKTTVSDYMNSEARFRIMKKSDPERFQRVVEATEEQVRQRTAALKHMAAATAVENA